MRTRQRGRKGLFGTMDAITRTLREKRVVLWGLVMSLALILFPSRNLAEQDPPDCGATTCDPYTCTTGSVDKPGTMTPTSKEICVGGSPGTPNVSGTTFKKGRKERTCHNNCESWPDGADISYSEVYRWEPAIPSKIDNCGTYNYKCYVKGVTTDTDCPSPTEEKEVGTYTVTVKAIKGETSFQMKDPQVVLYPLPQSPQPTNWPTTGDVSTITAKIEYCGGSTATLTVTYVVPNLDCPGYPGGSFPAEQVNLTGAKYFGDNDPAPTQQPRSFWIADDNLGSGLGIWYHYTGWQRRVLVSWSITPGNCEATITITQPKAW